jgi:hypothetical protein
MLRHVVVSYVVGRGGSGERRAWSMPALPTLSWASSTFLPVAELGVLAHCLAFPWQLWAWRWTPSRGRRLLVGGEVIDGGFDLGLHVDNHLTHGDPVLDVSRRNHYKLARCRCTTCRASCGPMGHQGSIL